MKLGVISQNFMQFEFEEGLQRAQALGFQAMEVGACGLWGTKFCDREKLLGGPRRDAPLARRLCALRSPD